LAVDEARRLNHHYIGTEHLLLGLVREGEGIAAGVLESLGVNLEKVRTATIQVLSQANMSREAMATVTPMGESGTGGSHVRLLPSQRRANLLPVALIVGSLLLLGVGITQMANTIVYGMPAQISLAVSVATAILGAICAIQAAGLLLAARHRAVGYALVLVTALFWIIMSILGRTHILSATAAYRDTVLAQGLDWTMLGLGALVVIMTIITPVTVTYRSDQRRHRRSL
ncbi:MAG TPA: Clp protease N-terminal domain-containing protein, partial [Ktedonobacterales bacterium]